MIMLSAAFDIVQKIEHRADLHVRIQSRLIMSGTPLSTYACTSMYFVYGPGVYILGHTLKCN